MVKAVRTEGAAYVTYPGISREEAEKKGLAVVEYNLAAAPPIPVYGRYETAPAGSGLGVTVPVSEDTEIVGAGSLGPDPDAASGGKGEAMKPTDPIAHPVPGTEPHKDGGEAMKQGEQADSAKPKK